ncbi:MAG: glycosyltransferase family 4 protein [Lachnospiraceae bacterium]
MNVLMIEHFSPGNAYTEELLKELATKDEITVMSRKDANDFHSNVVQLRKMYGGGTHSKVAAIIKYIFGIFALMKEVKCGKYQIIHVQTFKNAKVEMRLYKRKRKETKLIHTVHNLLPHEAKDEDKELYSGFYNICDALIVHNEECKHQLMSSFGIKEDKIYVIPHGTYSIILPKEIEKKRKKTHFLMFGVIRQYKGLDILLKAISMIPKSERQQVEFIVAGRQYLNQNPVDYNEMAQELGITDCVQLILRRIDDAELPELFGWADVCLFPYREIYGSGALLMAYSYNKPVIVSDVPVFIEETDDGKTGLVFRNNDANSLANCIISFSHLTPYEKENMSAEIKRLVESKYNWKVSAKLTDDIYRRTIQ